MHHKRNVNVFPHDASKSPKVKNRIYSYNNLSTETSSLQFPQKNLATIDLIALR